MFVYCYVSTIEKKNVVLLVSSLIFYAWGGPKYLLLLLLMAFISWFSALQIHRFRESLLLKRLCLILGVGLSLALLGYFKYAGFFLENLQKITGFPEAIPEIVLPIGISFYTFQLISYVVDVYWGNVKPQRRYWLILLYCSLFHQCIAGPIVRYKDVAREIEHRKPRIPEIGRGINRFTIGLVKKAVFANSCAEIADMMLPEGIMNFTSVPALGLWLGALMYMLQIYLDFSAYSDMAIGMGLMVGFHYDENFNYPYISGSIKEFWNRWHISLGTFFRDYVYIPLGGNRKGARRRTINLLIVWGLTGFWHGASWNFIFWGLYFFLFIYMENTFLLEKFSHLPRFVSHLYAMVVVYFGWVLFRCESLGNLGAILKGMFGLNHNGFIDLSTSVLFQNNLYLLIFCIIASTPLLKNIGTYIKRLDLVHYRIPYLTYAYEIVIPPVLLILSLLALVGNSYNPFLYFQF